MKLTHKAIIICGINILLTFALGIWARDIYVNRTLLAGENAEDQERLRLAEHSIIAYREGLQFRMRAVLSTAAAVSVNPDQGFEVFEDAVTGAADLSVLHFFGTWHQEQLQVYPGELTRFLGSKLSDQEARDFLQASLTKLNSAPIDANTQMQITTGLTRTSFGPAAFAIGRSARINKNFPDTFLLVRGLGETFVRNLTARFGLDAEQLTPRQLEAELLATSSQIGLRNRQNRLYTAIHNDSGELVLPLRIQTPERRFDDRVFTPTIIFAFVGTLVFWCFTLALLHFGAFKPLANLSAQLRNIRLTSNYRDPLQSRRRDEFGKLVDECNNLLMHVADHTEELHERSYRDALTNIPNRRQLDDKLVSAWAHCRRHQQPLSVIIFDLDYFKQYNDVYGHSGGDSVLKRFAEILCNTFHRANDTIARSGGEEFVAVLEETKEANALALASKVLRDLYAQEIRHVGSRSELYVTASAGIATLIPGELDTRESLFQRADKALYSAKSGGRNRAMVYTGPAILRSGSSKA